MKIINGLVYGSDYKFHKGTVTISGDRFADGNIDSSECESVLSKDANVIDANGCYVIPGLIDIHVHGCNNKDFCDATVESIGEFLRFEASKGVCSICPTTMTVSKDKLLAAADAANEYFRLYERQNNGKSHIE